MKYKLWTFINEMIKEQRMEDRISNQLRNGVNLRVRSKRYRFREQRIDNDKRDYHLGRITQHEYLTRVAALYE